MRQCGGVGWVGWWGGEGGRFKSINFKAPALRCHLCVSRVFTLVYVKGRGKHSAGWPRTPSLSPPFEVGVTFTFLFEGNRHEALVGTRTLTQPTRPASLNMTNPPSFCTNTNTYPIMTNPPTLLLFLWLFCIVPTSYPILVLLPKAIFVCCFC